MNKLVSKNPVQRFKEGKKIQKMSGGNVIQIDSENDIWQDKSTGKKYQRNWRGRRWNRTPEGGDFENYFEEYSPSTVQQRIGMNGKPIIDTVVQKSTTPKYSGAELKARLTKKSLRFNKSGVDDTARVTVKPSFSKTTQPYFYKQFAYRAKDFGADKIKEWQRKLHVKDDGIWGNKTEAAYQQYLLNQNIANDQDIVKPVEQEKPVGSPVYQNLMANRQAPTITTPVTKSTDSYTPGYYSDLARQALQFTNLSKYPTYKYTSTFFKQGGQLPSRNIVERFKQKNFRQVAQ